MTCDDCIHFHTCFLVIDFHKLFFNDRWMFFRGGERGVVEEDWHRVLCERCVSTTKPMATAAGA